MRKKPHKKAGRPSAALILPACMVTKHGIACPGVFRFRKRMDRHLIA